MANQAVSTMFLQVGTVGYYPIPILDITGLDTTSQPGSLLVSRKSTGTTQAFPIAGWVAPTPFAVQGGARYATLAAALAAVPAGGTITVAAGTYPISVAGAHVPASAGNVTISASGAVTFDGQGFNATGSNGKPRGIYGKAFLHASDPITVTVNGVAFVNCGDPTDVDTLAAIYSETGANLVVDNCSFDNCGDGIFGGSGCGSYTGTGNKFGQHATNGINQPGYSHDVYWNNAAASSVTETDCLHYGNANGHSLKSRAKLTTLTRGLYTSIGGGRAIDFPDGGTLNLIDVYINQAAGADANVLGFGDESAINGPPAVTMTGGTIAIRRANSQLMMQNGGTFTGVGVGQYFDPGAALVLIGTGALSGIVLQAGAGTLATAPAMPG